MNRSCVISAKCLIIMGFSYNSSLVYFIRKQYKYDCGYMICAKCPSCLFKHWLCSTITIYSASSSFIKTRYTTGECNQLRKFWFLYFLFLHVVELQILKCKQLLSNPRESQVGINNNNNKKYITLCSRWYPVFVRERIFVLFFKDFQVTDIIKNWSVRHLMSDTHLTY